MKNRIAMAVLLTVLFLALIFPSVQAEEAFTIDERRILQGMNRSWLQGYEPTINRDAMTFVLPILSSTATGSIDAQIILADESLSPFKLQTMQTKAQPIEDGLWNVRFTLNLHEDRRNGDYAAVIRITGTDKQGAMLQTEIPYTFRIRDGQLTREVIRLQVDQIESDFRVGEDGIVTITLTNPCKTVPFEQPVLQISDSTGDIIPQRSGVMYLDDLAPGETVTVQFPMTVLPKAAVSPHIMELDMRWTALGQSAVQSETHTLPVTQEIKMEHGGLRMADSVVAGDAITMTLPVLNRGKASIMDVMVTLELPGVVERQSVLVGVIAPGETKNAQLTVTPGKHLEGQFSGTITVSATDNDGNPAELSLPVALSVEKPVQYDMSSMQAAPEEQSNPVIMYALAAGCVVLLITCIVQGAVLRKKIRKLEEDRL